MSGSDGRAYWRYALGETLLIVVGILLALQINNWNEGRIAQAKIWVSAAKVEAEIEAEKIRLEIARELISEHIDSLRWLLTRTPSQIISEPLSEKQFHLAAGIYHMSYHKPSLPHFRSFMASESVEGLDDLEMEQYMVKLMHLVGAADAQADALVNLQYNFIDPYLVRSFPLSSIAEHIDFRGPAVDWRDDSSADLSVFLAALEAKNFALIKHAELAKADETLEQLFQHYQNFPAFPL